MFEFWVLNFEVWVLMFEVFVLNFEFCVLNLSFGFLILNVGFCKTVPCVAIWLKLEEKTSSMLAEPGSS